MNPFDDDGVSTLITTFFGSDEDRGFEQLKNIAAVCPKHGPRAAFLIDRAERYQMLRGLIRMSSGVSGFRPSCAPKDV